MAAINSPKASPFHVAIVGGGIGGVALAIGLAKQPNITFTIYEAAGQFSEVGAGVGFGANSQAAMKLLHPSIWESFTKLATFNMWESKARSWFDFTVGEKGPDEGKRIIEVQMDNEKPVGTAIRAHFLDGLVELLPKDCAEFSKRVTELDQTGEKVIMHFIDGTSASADVVVGCDGIRSVCREAVLGADAPFTQPIFTGKVCYRGLIPVDEVIKVVGEEMAVNRQMYLGHGAHVLTFPVAQGKTVNVAAFATQKSGKWEGRWVQHNQKENLHKAYEGWGEKVSKILSLIDNPDVWALFEHPLAPTYHKKHICLLGDSAHATTPHFGAGAGLAIEDAYVLSNLLGLCTSLAEVPHAFKAYETVRIPRTHAITALSNEQGNIMDLEGTGIGDNLEKTAQKLDTTIRQVWNVDLPKQLATATEVFEEDVRKSSK